MLSFLFFVSRQFVGLVVRLERQALLHCFGLSVGCAAMQMCLTVRNETANCRVAINHNVRVCAVVGIGGLSNGATRNAKADQLRPFPGHKYF